MNYERCVAELLELSEEPFAAFQRRLIPTNAKILGVRTPALRKTAKRLLKDRETVLSFPDEYYEVTFLKLTLASSLSFEELIPRLPSLVSSIDNWATCDTFKPKCFEKNQERLLPILEELFSKGGEFFERFVLVTFLSFYMERKYLPIIETYLLRAHANEYYIRMAAAWLVAEILVKFPLEGERILKNPALDKGIMQKAVQKARESFRVPPERKEYLKEIKINLQG